MYKLSEKPANCPSCGEAESIRIINEALAANPRYVDLKAVEKWDGKLPQVTGSTGAPFINLRENAR
jgi:hypothetical protein